MQQSSLIQGKSRTRSPMRFLFFILALFYSFSLLYSCSSPKPVSDAGLGEKYPPISSPKAFVIERKDQSGSFGVIDLKTLKVYPKLGPASNDAVAKHWKGKIFIINRFGHDNIQVMDAHRFTLIKQYSVGIGSNPQDVAVLNSEKAYVSRLADPKLLIVHPTTGKKRGEIDLSDLAETNNQSCSENKDCKSKKCIQKHCAVDGIPELAQMHLHGSFLYVLVQRLNRNKRFASEHKGMVAIIDTKTDKLVKTLQTAAGNPISIQVSVDSNSLYIGQAGAWIKQGKAVLDGVIQKLDLTTQTFKKTVLKETDLQGNLSSFVIVSAQKGFAIRSSKSWQTELISFSLTNGKIGKVIARSECLAQNACYSFHQIRFHPPKQLFLVDRYLKKPGIRIFDTSTEKEQTQKPIQMGLPPSSILFYSAEKP